MTIEHLEARAKEFQKTFDYENLLASCEGGSSERQGKTNETKKLIPLYCNAFRSDNNEDLPVTPLQETCHKQFIFNINGEITGTNSEAQKTIDLLNLDNATLKYRREAAITGLLFENIDKEIPDQLISEEEAEILFKNLPNNQEYYSALKYNLEKFFS